MNSFLIFTLFVLSFNKNVLSYPSSSSTRNLIIKPLGTLGEMVENFIKTTIIAKTPMKDFPNSGRKQAVLGLKREESLPIKLDDKYGRLQEFVGGIFEPKPIVDITEEREKYGNDGGSSRKVGTAVIGGFEALSNGLNAAVEVPFVASKQFGKKITASLNIVGGKLVGL